ncbi:hypothetical protein FKP32DRAFT_1090978 [Trametes sanguinea]|nr:hypothetical protein FKP32DRAFT_1090978 [Trametes sanguinea]
MSRLVASKFTVFCSATLSRPCFEFVLCWYEARRRYPCMHALIIRNLCGRMPHDRWILASSKSKAITALTPSSISAWLRWYQPLARCRVASRGFLQVDHEDLKSLSGKAALQHIDTLNPPVYFTVPDLSLPVRSSDSRLPWITAQWTALEQRLVPS